jgi:Ca2+-dependent lipid-binding protein
MTNNIIVEPILTGGGNIETILDHIKGCINRNFCSSTLFLAPAVYSYLVNYSRVMWGSLICFITSTEQSIKDNRYSLCQ